MKLISMHIDNFGGLHNYDYEFEDGLNVILHDNGWGKTTMAAFLKAMLYGFDSKRSKDITENERKRYLPWQGGTYGGILDFEAEGVRYRISRTFGETPRFDRAKIVNLDKKTTAKIDPEKIGETLFRLDASAFQRSVFINQNGLSIDGAASSIHTRLNALVSQANDVAAYDDAIAKLTAQIKIYEKTGSRGQLGDITRQISAMESQRDQLEVDIAAQDRARERISQIDVLLGAINHDLEMKKKKLDEVSGEAKKREASKKLLDDIDKQMADIQAQMDAIKAELGGEIPTASEIEQIKQQKRSAVALAQLLTELDESYAKLAAAYSDLLEKYNGALPATSQLDEIQNIYGELQGIRSSGSESTENSDEKPEGYTTICNIVENDSEYVSRLRITVGNQMTIQQFIRKLETAEDTLKREQDSWTDKKQRYASLSEEVSRLQNEAEDKKAYKPESIDPVIVGMETLQKRQGILSQQISELDAAMKREEDDWTDKKRRYQFLSEEVDKLHVEVENRSRFSSEHIKPVVASLEDLQQQQQLVDMRSEELKGEGLSDEQETLLAQYPDELPDIAEGNSILKKMRGITQVSSDIQGLEARKTGEQSKADSLQMSIDQLNALPDSSVVPVKEPKKSSGMALLGVGIGIAVVGAVLIFLVSPMMAAVAAVGVLLAVFGVVNHSAYKKKLQAYEAYMVSAAQQQENLKKKDELEAKLATAKLSVTAIQSQIDRLHKNMQADQSTVDEWALKWLNGGEMTESAVAAVLEHAEQVAKLRQKKQETAYKKSFVTEKTTYITAERKKADEQYPEFSGKSIAEALDFLRSSETDYKLYASQLQTAQRSLDKFLSESGLSSDQLRAEESPNIAKLKATKNQKEQELDAISVQRGVYDDTYPEIAGASYEDALRALRAKAGDYKVIGGQLESAKNNLQKFLGDAELSEEDFSADESPKTMELVKNRDEASAALAQAISQANEVLAFLKMDTDANHILQVLRDAEKLLNEYSQYADKLKDRAGRQEQKQQQIDMLQAELAKKLEILQGRYPEAEIPDRLTLVREDVGSAVKLKEKLSEIVADQKKQKERLIAAEAAVKGFISTYAQFTPETDDVLTEIYEKAGFYSDKMTAIQQLETQKSAVNQSQNPENTSGGTEEMSLRDEIAGLEARRDNLLVEYTQQSDFIRQADKSLERYPDTMQEIHGLYEQKQKAQATVDMLKRTIQLITKAKENLADRYLSKVEQLFNNYMHIWLNNDAVKGILDINFNITIEENDKIHVAEGYSTGYCDLIDFCMRLALVDTLFESEQPFLILDDPFVNLDVDRLDKALDLLNVMAANKQIVYFVCHPIRAVEVNEDSLSRAEFVKLAEATRKTIEASKNLGTGRRKIVRKSPREMYRVNNPGAAVAIKPAKSNYIITNNIFGMNFVLNDVGSLNDASYELFFIDAAGHVLNDRQLLEIKSGKLSTERIQFCLNTRDDSGDQYELMIRESGQEDYEVVARIPFQAKLAFAGTSNFDF